MLYRIILLSPLPIQRHQLCLKHQTWISLHLARIQGTTTKESEDDPRQLVPKYLTPSLPLSTWDVLRVLDLIRSMTFELPLVKQCYVQPLIILDDLVQNFCRPAIITNLTADRLR